MIANTRSQIDAPAFVRRVPVVASPSSSDVITSSTAVAGTAATAATLPNTKQSNVSYVGAPGSKNVVGIMMTGTDELSSYKTYSLNSLLYTESYNGSQAEYDEYAKAIVNATSETQCDNIIRSAPAYLKEYVVNNQLIAAKNANAPSPTGNPADLQFATTGQGASPYQKGQSDSPADLYPAYNDPSAVFTASVGPKPVKGNDMATPLPPSLPPISIPTATPVKTTTPTTGVTPMATSQVQPTIASGGNSIAIGAGTGFTTTAVDVPSVLHDESDPFVSSSGEQQSSGGAFSYLSLATPNEAPTPKPAVPVVQTVVDTGLTPPTNQLTGNSTIANNPAVAKLLSGSTPQTTATTTTTNASVTPSTNPTMDISSWPWYYYAIGVVVLLYMVEK